MMSDSDLEDFDELVYHLQIFENLDEFSINRHKRINGECLTKSNLNFSEAWREEDTQDYDDLLGELKELDLAWCRRCWLERRRRVSL